MFVRPNELQKGISMLKRLTTLAIAFLFAGTMSACLFDPEQTKKDDDPPGPSLKYEDLSEESHVLNNLELSYNEMNVTEYERLFDQENFVFHFSDGDVGGEVPTQWGAAEELASAQNMFTQAGTNPILSIELDLIYDGLQWDTVPLEEFPDEEIKRIIGVVYDFRIQTENETTYITSGAPKADFYVRNVNGEWKLVKWFDRADGS